MAMSGPPGGTRTKHGLPGGHVYEGTLYSGVFPVASLDKVKTFNFRNSDVLVVGYPKSGTTWMQELTWLVSHPDEISKASIADINVRVPFLEVCPFTNDKSISAIDLLDQQQGTRCMKTHLNASFFMQPLDETTAKFIVVFRNVKDVLVSYFHMYTSNPELGQFKGTFSEFFELIKDNWNVNHGNWFDFVLSWWKVRQCRHVVFFMYEDMLDDPRGTIMRLSSFLTKTIPDDTINEICERTSFAALKANTNLSEYRDEAQENISPFYRKGRVGDWKNYFSTEQSEYIDQLCGAIVNDTDLNFRYEQQLFGEKSSI